MMKNKSKAGRLYTWIGVCTIGFTLIPWVFRLFQQGLDYDESEHAHVIWMVSQGLIPFKDFFECHTPFFWYLLAPISQLLPQTGSILVYYRGIAFIGSLLFLSALIFYMRPIKNRDDILWAAPLLGLVILHPKVLYFLSQFRTDTWSYALLFVALIVLRDSQKNKYFKQRFNFGFLSSVSVFFNPKLFLLPVVVFIFDSIFVFRKRGKILRLFFAYGSGVALSTSIAFIFFMVSGIEIIKGYEYVVVYQYLFGKMAFEGFGMISGMLESPFLFLLIVCGIGSWIYGIRKNIFPLNYVDLSIVVFILLQIVFIGRPHLQFVVPVILVGLIFVPCIGALFLGHRNKIKKMALVLSFVIFCGASFNQLNSRNVGQLWNEIKYINWIIDNVPEGEPVVAFPFFHPIFRPNTFYGWINSFSEKGYDTESIMQHIKAEKKYFTEENYKAELDQKRPYFIIKPKGPSHIYYSNQSRVIDAYLEKNRHQYEKVMCEPFDCYFIRSD